MKKKKYKFIPKGNNKKSISIFFNGLHRSNCNQLYKFSYGWDQLEKRQIKLFNQTYYGSC